MPAFALRRGPIAAAAAALLAAASLPATATDHVFQLSGHWADVSTVIEGTTFQANLPLVDTDTADGLLPGLTLAVGDSFTAAITLDGPLPLPGDLLASKPSTFVLMQPFQPRDDGTAYTVFMQETLSFSLAGAPVQLPAGFQAYGGAGGSNIGLGGLSSAGTPAFAFDQVTMRGEVFLIADSQSRYYDSVALLPDRATLISTATVVPVPEPAAWALWLAGLGGLGAATRRRAPHARAT